ncbi:hypothetical protein BDY24DRAFT_385852 [Mrakia frigida]|uniref:uncharacterized protein n=1 Tax=Mrakia frigida TaxID=29902 RepID=UPI003FCC0602
MLSTLLPILAFSSLSLVSARSVPNRMEARMMAHEAATTTAHAYKAEATYAPAKAEATYAPAKEYASYDTTTAVMAHEAMTTEAAVYSYETTPPVHEVAATTTAAAVYAYETTTAEYVAPAHTTAAAAAATYGSGSTNWDGFNNCVQSCQAQFGGIYTAGQAAPTGTATAVAGATKTHTVIVAPTQGVLKFVPFAVDAAVGDEIVYKWGANVHTVTKGSGGALCNASKDNGFTSGRQNITFEFKKTVNDTKPLWVFCGVPTHCQKGMFAGVNIKKVTPSDQNATGAFDAATTTLAGTDANIAAMWNQSMAYVGNNSIAWAWGKDLDTSELEAWAVAPYIQNVLETRMTIAANPASSVDGFDLDTMVSPPQLVLAASSTAPATLTGDAAASTATVEIAEPSSAVGAEGLNSGASSLARPAGLLVLLAVPILALLL